VYFIFSTVFLRKLFSTQNEISYSEILSYTVELGYNVMKGAE